MYTNGYTYNVNWETGELLCIKPHRSALKEVMNGLQHNREEMDVSDEPAKELMLLNNLKKRVIQR